MTETTTETVERVRADLERQEAEARERRRETGSRTLTKADRERARERHIVKTAEVIDRAAAEAPIEVEGACIICGQRRGLESEKPRQVRDGPARIGWKGAVGHDIWGEACSKCRGAILAKDTPRVITRRLWEERGDLMKRSGLRREPSLTAVDQGASASYDVLGDNWWELTWAYQIQEAQREGRKPPSKPKSPFAWLKLDDIDEGADR